MIKQIIKKITNKLGFEVRKIKTKKEIKLVPLNRPIYVEFVGISGVGKTTLYREVKKQRGKKAKWIDVREFLGSQKYPLKEELFGKYQEIIDYKIKYIVNKSFSALDKMKLISFFYKNISEEIIVNYYNKNTTVIFEDGMLHNFSDALNYVYNSNKELFLELIKDRIVVYCYSTPETIANQIIKRKNEGALRPQHKVSSFEELVEKQKQSLKNKEQFINILKENHVPFLMINTSDDIESNAKKVNAFISSLQKKN
jgi:shikimate kinase